MSLTIFGKKLCAEHINHPDDIYIIFDGGMFIWNWKKNEDLNVCFNGDSFTLKRGITPEVSEFNKWANKLIQEQEETRQIIAQRTEHLHEDFEDEAIPVEQNSTTEDYDWFSQYYPCEDEDICKDVPFNYEA